MNVWLGQLFITSGVLSLVFIGVDLFLRLISTKNHKPESNYHRHHRDFKCVCHKHFRNPYQMWKHIFFEWLDAHFNCWCGHAKTEHTGYSGPNSIGQWSHGECVHDASILPPYRVGGCGCSRFRRNWRTFGRM